MEGVLAIVRFTISWLKEYHRKEVGSILRRKSSDAVTRGREGKKILDIQLENGHSWQAQIVFWKLNRYTDHESPVITLIWIDAFVPATVYLLKESASNSMSWKALNIRSSMTGREEGDNMEE